MAAHAILLRSLLKTKWQNVTMAEVINAIILCQVSPQDQRIEQVALEKDIKTEDQFLSEMRVLALAKRPASSTSNTSTGSETKRHKLPDSRNKCLYW
ncbi:uncharacterized protein LOC117151533 isoform X2 [Bombus impatiens]|uniref:Uncharacterized protein LOC117151533 isoform X2 n=1 Tax=Bombus impatiens TaxID=132113 RepID=A0A6P8LCE4_BOMIM|nr:uncharacterized protein LOC117151533 isoform X2 [Bombus impatiens]